LFILIVKEVDQEIITVLGGAHPSSVPHEVLADNNVDFCVIGEGEYTVLELVKGLEVYDDFSDIKDIAYRNITR